MKSIKIKYIIQLIRPEQWVKNLIIFFPVFFSGNILNGYYLFSCFIAFFAFSLAASAIYCLNDIYDLEADRIHPKKCKRPIPMGNISVKIASFVMIFCFICSLGILFLFRLNKNYYLIFFILFYLILNIAYCIKLKQYVLIDVVAISIGFVLRMFVGGSATNVWISEWIIIMTFLLALFLAFAKRRDDVLLFVSHGVLIRKNTNKYNLDFINQVITIIGTVIIVSYVMWTLSMEIMQRFHSRNLYFTAIFVLLGIIRYLQVTIVNSNSGNPTTIFFKDRFIQYCILGWLISFSIIIYI